MKNKTIMHIANYSTLYKADFIALLERLENFLNKENRIVLQQMNSVYKL